MDTVFKHIGKTFLGEGCPDAKTGWEPDWLSMELIALTPWLIE